MADLDYSQITDQLYIGRTPRLADYPLLAAQGIRLVINMRAGRRPYPDPDDSGLQFLWLPTYDFPLLPIPIRSLERGVWTALPVLASRGGVYTHCRAGQHRGVAIGACILIAQGYTLEAASELIKSKRRSADPDLWYIRRRIERFARIWRRSVNP